MALLETNPTQLQYSSGDKIPLFLIHDGGGTIFKYFLLGDIGRSVYGIQDPKFDCENNWEGGIIEMAQEYLTLIKAIRGTGPIFLGGWSLGGLVSLQIARLLDDERQQKHTERDTHPLFVAGVILIDSPYPSSWCDYRAPFVDFEPEFPVWTPETVRKNVTRRFEVCDQLIATWEPPLWEARRHSSAEDGNPQVSASESSVGRLKVRPISSSPPVVLLKAMSHARFPGSATNGILQVDLFRDDALLGWERYACGLLEKVHHISGHHFDLFDQDDKACFDLFAITWRESS
ncbi:hypothetical protein EKO04_001730 [Ascochyta lentis]|uniref:Thioesterase domain-containing protein n=1 Tax=Ascochyta lentis TaxID=205686 RepID=A0A8H7MGX8_9PLEO|nr:hypothetical protein EKO04_001730 [Ascochyta lentis]